MRFELQLAVRYLRTPRRHQLANLTALFAVVGIACGAAAMIVANAAANGFRDAMQEKILANTAHISVFKIDNAEITDLPRFAEQIQAVANVRSVRAESFDNVLLIGASVSNFAAVKGARNLTVESQTELPNEKIIVAVGRELAAKTNLQRGDTAQILANADFAPVSSVIEIGEIFTTGLHDYDSSLIRVSLADAARLTGRKPDTATILSVETGDFYRARETADKLREKLGENYRIIDWQEANRPLFAALWFERRIALVTISLIIFIAALNIATTLALVVNERQTDIAVLRTCGATTKNIVLIFVIEGFILSLTGALGGVLLGVALCFSGNYLNLISLPPDVYAIDKIVLRPDFFEIAGTVALIFILSLAATWFPARTAARVRPLENLKN